MSGDAPIAAAPSSRGESIMSGQRGSIVSRRMKTLLSIIAGLVLASVLWWASGRLSTSDRRLSIRQADTVATTGVDDGTVRILAWNIAHGRGDTEQGFLQNWRGGSRAERLNRLDEIAAVLRRVDADIVVLNEVDFDAGWSHGVDQAAYLARAAGYSSRVEQRNFDFRIPFESWAFGNALLTRLPVSDARWIDLPDHSFWEDVVLGSKEAAVVRLRVGSDSLAIVPVHLEYRPGETRLRAVPVLEAAKRREPAPLVLAGDFNTAPPGWPEVGTTTAWGRLLSLGWRSARAPRSPVLEELTFPTYAPVESRDWILVEPSLRVVEARVLPGTARLSDHAPVVAEVRMSDGH